MLDVRERLRHIKERHVAEFEEIILRQKLRKEQRAKPKAQAQAQPKQKAKAKAKPKPSPPPKVEVQNEQNAKAKAKARPNSKREPAPSKYKPQKVPSQQAIGTKAAEKPKKLTFAEFQKGKRLNNSAATSSSSSFSNRFTRSAGFGSGVAPGPMSYGGDRDRGRFRGGSQANQYGNRQHNDEEHNSSSFNGIRPRK